MREADHAVARILELGVALAVALERGAGLMVGAAVELHDQRAVMPDRVYLTAGSGKWDVNGRTLGDYFPRPSHVSAIQQPFTATDTLGRYDVKANVEGGGNTGQAGALRLAVARALVKIDEEYRRKLRDLGLL